MESMITAAELSGYGKIINIIGLKFTGLKKKKQENGFFLCTRKIKLIVIINTSLKHLFLLNCSEPAYK